MAKTSYASAKNDIDWKATIAFTLVHLAPFAAFFVDAEITAGHWITCIALYFGRMFFITGGYHRYFSHRAFETGRVMQFLFAVGAQTSTQKSVLWWAAHHRWHHKHSDGPKDVHSPQDGFWYSHLGWIFSRRHEKTELDMIPDLAKYPELRWLDRFEQVPSIALGAICFFVGGIQGLLIGFFLSTAVLYHGTFFVNSLAHVMGSRRYPTTDTSRNSWFITLLTMGEGWHNNHHYYQASARQGFFWWEWDPTYYILKGMSLLGLVKNLRPVPARVREGRLTRKGARLEVNTSRDVPAATEAAASGTSASVKPAVEAAVEAVEAALSVEKLPNATGR